MTGAATASQTPDASKPKEEQPTMEQVTPEIAERVASSLESVLKALEKVETACKAVTEAAVAGKPIDDLMDETSSALMDANDAYLTIGNTFSLLKLISESDSTKTRPVHLVELIEYEFPGIRLPPVSEMGSAQHIELLYTIYKQSGPTLRKIAFFGVNPYLHAFHGIIPHSEVASRLPWRQAIPPGKPAPGEASGDFFLLSMARLCSHQAMHCLALTFKSLKARQAMSQDLEFLDFLAATISDMAIVTVAAHENSLLGDKDLVAQWANMLEPHVQMLLMLALENREEWAAHVSSPKRSKSLPVIFDPKANFTDPPPRSSLFATLGTLRNKLDEKGGTDGENAGNSIDLFRLRLVQIGWPDKVNLRLGSEKAAFLNSIGIGTPNAQHAPPVSCERCGKKGVKLLRCSRCHNAWYCSSACQKEAWTSGHKKECPERAKNRDGIPLQGGAAGMPNVRMLGVPGAPAK